MKEELGECTYCFRIGRAKNLEAHWEVGKEDFIQWYCPDCLPIVKQGLREYGRLLGHNDIPPFYRFGKRKYIKNNPYR